MKFNKWLKEEVGRLTSVAEKFDITLSAVSQWRDNGVPKNRMKEVRDFTGGLVSIEEMVPDTIPRKQPRKPRQAQGVANA